MSHTLLSWPFHYLLYIVSYALMRCFQNGRAYFGTAVSYASKMWMKSTLRANVIKLFSSVLLRSFILGQNVCPFKLFNHSLVKQTVWLITKIGILRTKKFSNIGPWCQMTIWLSGSVFTRIMKCSTWIVGLAPRLQVLDKIVAWDKRSSLLCWINIGKDKQFKKNWLIKFNLPWGAVVTQRLSQIN